MKHRRSPTNAASPLAASNDPPWRAVFECAGIGMSITDVAGRIVASNRAYQRIVGFTADELECLTFVDLTHEDDRAAMAELRAAMSRGERMQATVEKRYRHRDGQVVWVRVNTTVLGGDDGEPRMLMAMVEDITDRKLAEDAVRLSQAYLADAQRISRTGSWVLNPFTWTLFWSVETYHILGFEPSSAPPTYSQILERIHPDEASEVDEDVRRGIEEKCDFEGEYRLLRLDGTVLHIHYHGHPVLGPTGDVVSCIGTIADVTALKRAELERNASVSLSRTLSARLVRVQDDERRRIARQLHETTAQDLAALKMNLAALDRSGAVAGDSGREILEESVTLAGRAMEDIRVLSYLLHPPLLDEAGLVSMLRWYTRGFGHRSGITVRLAVSEEFPRLPQEIETTLFRCVQESLINIHRHAESASAEIRLATDVDRVTLEVQDWGRGLPQEMDQRAPEGVGIAGMRERIEQLGGGFALDSGPGGTVIRVQLPLASEIS